MEISNEQLRENMGNFLGQPCLIIGEHHPYKGHRGTTVRLQDDQNGVPKMVVEIKDGVDTIVEHGEVMFLL